MKMEIHFRAMGSAIHVMLYSNKAEAHQVLAQVPAWFETWEQSLSRFRFDSELSRWNRGEINIDTASPVLRAVLKTAQWVRVESNGIVSPYIIDALEHAGYVQSFDVFGSSGPEQSISFAEPYVRSEMTGNFAPERKRIDLGGMAKGWAAHQAMLKLKQFGPVLVNAGGDMAISEEPPASMGWMVDVIDPFSPGNITATLNVSNGGVATSGVDYRNWKLENKFANHIIDPRTDESVQSDVISATVIAPTVIEAEMAAKFILISGRSPGMKWLDDKRFAGYLIGKDAGIYYNDDMEKYLYEKN